MKTPQGFTLIELTITIAIVGILAAAALPAYTDYILRAKLSEVIYLVGSAKPMLLSEYFTTGEMPKSNSDIARKMVELIESSEYVDRVVFIRYGNSPHYAAFEVWFEDVAPGYNQKHWTFDFRPPGGDPENGIRLYCNNYNIPSTHIPSICRR